MQDVFTLKAMIEKGRPDLKTDTIGRWVYYLSKLKGCHLYSAVAQSVDEEAWKGERKAGIGGSDIAAVAGKSPWKSARQIWLSKTGQLPDSRSKSEAASWGNLLEQTIAEEWSRRTGKPFINIPVILQSDENSFMLANIDGFVLTDDRSDISCILEIKTTNEYNRTAWQEGPVPEYYMCQANWYTAVTGLPGFYITCLVGGQSLYDYYFPKDDDLIKQLIDAGRDFWYNYVIPLKEPPATEVDLAALKTVDVEVEEKPEEPAMILEDDESNRLIDAYVNLRENISALKKVKDALYAKIFVLLNDRQAISHNHTLVPTTTGRRTCDFDLLQERYPAIYNECISTTVSKSIRIK